MFTYFRRIKECLYNLVLLLGIVRKQPIEIYFSHNFRIQLLLFMVCETGFYNAQI